MSNYYITDTQLNNLRSAVATGLGEYKYNWNDLVSAIRNHYCPSICLKAGTQILMADGSTKAIEDIQPGEQITSWDIIKNQPIIVKTYGVFKTGMEIDWSRCLFSDGRFLDLYKDHPIYNVEKEYPLLKSEWKYGEHALTIEGTTPTLSWIAPYKDVGYSKRYYLFSENSLYFANGILCGHPAGKSYEWYSGGFLNNDSITEKDVEVFTQVASIYQNQINETYANTEYLLQAAPLLEEIGRRSHIIKQNKEYLASVDYKTVKHEQGQLSEEEWAVHVEKCTECRNMINNAEVEKANLVTELKNLKQQYGIETKSKKKGVLFEEAYKIQMTHITGEDYTPLGVYKLLKK